METIDVDDLIGDLKCNARKYRVSKGRRCPICGEDSWCTAGPGWAICARSDGIGADRRIGEYGYLHAIGSRLTRSGGFNKPGRKPVVPTRDWAPLIKSWEANAADKLRLLAIDLELPVHTLRAIHVGIDGSTWIFPERDGNGRYIGVNRRLSRGRKLCEPGSLRGLTYADDILTAPGPIYLVEGPTDVAACLAVGMTAIGRPSSTGGTLHLVGLLTKLPRRCIVMIGENDQKPHTELSSLIQAKHNPQCGGCISCWPGKYGAERVAGAISRELGKTVGVVFPPTPIKDVREWYREKGSPEGTEATGLGAWIKKNLA